MTWEDIIRKGDAWEMSEHYGRFAEPWKKSFHPPEHREIKRADKDVRMTPLSPDGPLAGPFNTEEAAMDYIIMETDHLKNMQKRFGRFIKDTPTYETKERDNKWYVYYDEPTIRALQFAESYTGSWE